MGQVTVTLNGRNYRLQCEDGEERRLERVAQLVSDQLDSIVADVGQAGQERLLVMAALLIADELLDAREKRAKAG
ncbi:MAG: hypothetical protein RLZ98_2562 [Pseudomonadota bacterium]|jgi:cell division protein ZapA